MAKRSATAVWTGDLKAGKGVVSVQSGLFREAPYNFVSRFEEGPDTNPEELIAAAHAGCFAMATSAELSKAGFTAERLAATATVTLEPVDGKPTISTVHLELKAKVPGIDSAKFLEIVNGSKAGCPVSRVLNATITLDATLEA